MSDWEDYNENLAFAPANSMPRCDIEELKKQLETANFYRTQNSEYIQKLEKKLEIAVKALKYYAGMGHIDNVVACSNIENHCWCEGDIENGHTAEQALEEIQV